MLQPPNGQEQQNDAPLSLSRLGKPLSICNEINDPDRYNVSLKCAKRVAVTGSGFTLVAVLPRINATSS